MIRFTRVRPGRYEDQGTGFIISRDGQGPGRFGRVNWRVIAPDGTIMRQCESLAEAKIAAHEFLQKT